MNRRNVQAECGVDLEAIACTATRECIRLPYADLKHVEKKSELSSGDKIAFDSFAPRSITSEKAATTFVALGSVMKINTGHTHTRQHSFD